MVTFILDTLGRPEPASVRALSASDPGFIDAALELVLESWYRPARLRALPGRAVRVRIKQPVDFKMRRRSR